MAMARTLANGISRTQPVVTNNMARGNNINHLNLPNPYYGNNNLAQNAFTKANANLVNIVETNLANPLISTNQVLANDITAAVIEDFANVNQIPNIGAPAVLANVPKGVTYNFGNNAIPVTVAGGSQYGSQPVGINILADNLEVQGLVTVVGRMPIYGAVEINGNVPSDGKASVNYGCGLPDAA